MTGGLVTLSMIVKDEASGIATTLASVKPFVDRSIVVDTGSTDGTQDLVRASMAGVPGEVSAAPFVDFSTTRNIALERCGDATEFILWLDADDELHHGAALRSFLEEHRASTGAEHEAYLLRVDTGVVFDSPRVVRSRAGWRFQGVVHELLIHPDRPPPVRRVPDTVIRHCRTEASLTRTRARWERDVALLEAALARDPADTRAAFYLASTYAWLDRHDDAVPALERRIAMGGWVEEVFQARLQLARIASAQGRPWRDTLELYLAAHATSPHRAEPLHDVAFHYHQAGDHALCFLFARRGLDLPIPQHDRLFIEADVYDYKLADLVAASAYWVSELAVGEAAARQALRHRPDDARLQKNLAFYLARRK